MVESLNAYGQVAEIPGALESVNTALQEYSNGDDHSWVAQAKNPRQEIEALIGVFPQRLTQGGM